MLACSKCLMLQLRLKITNNFFLNPKLSGSVLRSEAKQNRTAGAFG